MCKHPPGDAKYMVDCRACVFAAGTVDIERDVTPRYDGSGRTYESTQYYDYVDPNFRGIPIRANFECDWPYATRRYNGAGPNAYNYQALVLKILLA